MLASGEIFLGNGTNAVQTIATLAVSKGGTGGTSATEARTNLEVMKSTVLYSNDSGPRGTITLSSSLSNFSYVDIFIKAGGAYYACQRIYSLDGKSAHLYVTGAYAPSYTVMCFTGVIKLSDTTITWNNHNDSFLGVTNSGIHTINFNRVLDIYKVIRYSY